MSNQQVGTVYQSIISDVIDASRVDFEEGGVDDAVLEALRQGWQKKLSQLNVATFPWDPKPEPPPQAIANPPTLPSNVGNYNHLPPPPQQQYQPTHGLSLPMSQGQPPVQQPRIKPEPEDANVVQPLINIPGATNAQQRAAQHLQNSYGQRAAASISAIQNTAGGSQGQHSQPQQQQGPPNPQLQYQPQMMQGQQQPQHQMHLPQQQQRPQGAPHQGIPQGQQQQTQMSQQQAQAQYRAMLARDAANRQAALQQQQPTIKQAQNDGAADEVEGVDVIRQYDATGNVIAMGTVEIDSMIREKILANARSMEGGGLMLPLKEASTKSSRQRKIERRQDGPLGGGDANDDDDDLKDDEDAINSDLDDPDDGLNEDEDEDDNMGHIMLCMYDKVQRVKNKWKCVMKDGVLTVNGKEYVFHKASGEYEW